MRRVFRAGFGRHVTAALGGTTRPAAGSYSEETLRWIQRCYNHFDSDPGNMERDTLKLCPVKCKKAKEAAQRIEPAWLATMELGGYMGEWPPNEALMILEVVVLDRMFALTDNGSWVSSICSLALIYDYGTVTSTYISQDPLRITLQICIISINY